MKAIFIDVETTGLDSSKDTIIELAAIIVNEKCEQFGDAPIFHEYCKPETFRDDFKVIEDLTGIKRQFLEDKQNDGQLYKSFTAWLKKYIDPFNKSDKAFFSGWNSPFDEGFVRKLFERNRDKYFGSYFYPKSMDVCGLTEYGVFIGKLDMPTNFRNAIVADKYGIKLEKAHSAISDIEATLGIFKYIKERI